MFADKETYKQAEKLAKEQIKKQPNNLGLLCFRHGSRQPVYIFNNQIIYRYVNIEQSTELLGMLAAPVAAASVAAMFAVFARSSRA